MMKVATGIHGYTCLKSINGLRKGQLLMKRILFSWGGRMKHVILTCKDTMNRS